MPKLTEQEYAAIVEKRSPTSPSGKNISLAFIFGGLICCIGQAFADLYKELFHLNTKDASLYSLLTLIFLAALLTALHVYDNIAKVAGAGIIVPITGFANSVVSPAMEFKTEGFVLGMAAKMFVVAGPVLVYGITSAILYGLILLIFI
ncbi:MAG TPA: stage V sporulation protein AC [Clostridiales bacterium]|jgi:stage V sporulation protein AC|nr:stage V sporulation protein AC [Clostridiales bacterium]